MMLRALTVNRNGVLGTTGGRIIEAPVSRGKFTDSISAALMFHMSLLFVIFFLVVLAPHHFLFVFKRMKEIEALFFRE